MNRRHLLLGGATLLLPFLGACSDDKPASTPAAPAPADPQEAYRLAATGSGFVVGQMLAADTIHVFFDAQCPHCATLWEAAKPALGRLKMSWMPIGLLSPDSVGYGAAILGDPDPVGAMNRNEAMLRARALDPSLARGADAAARAKVEANTGLFRRLGADSVPMLYFRHAGTGQYGARSGGMGTAELLALLGL